MGYDDADLRALPEYKSSDRFDNATKAALTLAEKMSRSAQDFDDGDMAGLRQHFSEPEIVELGCVIGLANYFNRFTTAFRVDLSGNNAPYESYEKDYL